MITDVNWDMENPSFEFVISPNGGFTRKISITRLFSDGIDDLRIKFKMELEQNETIVHIRGTGIKEVFEPPFVGKMRNEIKHKLSDKIKGAKGLQLLYLWGDAGIGKSRITQELFKDLDGKNYDFHFFLFNNNHNNPTKSIFKFLSKDNRYLNNVDSSNNLQHIINASSNKNSRRAVILLDDCHHAEKDFFEQIKLLEESSVPITILLCGRTDYSEGDISYFSFVQWITDKYPNNGWTVAPLEREETESLVRAMINQITDGPLKKICDMSMNNPLFIVQFIEYLLEAKIVELINRNTVNILNVATFESRDLIPSKVSQIYAKRIKHLLNTINGTACFELLLLLTVFSGDISTEHIMNYVDADFNITQELLKRRFIKKGENKNFVFIHESMYIHIRELLFNNKEHKMKISDFIISKPTAFWTQLSNYDIGSLFLWKKDMEQAKQYFVPAVDNLLEIDNYSNCKINPNVYNYLYDIYELHKRKKDSLELLKKTIFARVYITLHYLSPINTITECEKGLNLLNSPTFKNEDKFKYTLLSLKAHGLLNAGKLFDAELVLKELQSKWLISKEYFDQETFFDIIDRLCSLYIKYNCYEVALNYCDFMISIAENSKKKSLIALAHRTRSKLYFYKDKNECKKSLEIANELSRDGSSHRIYEDNRLSELLFEMQHNENCDWERIYNIAKEIKDISFDNSFYKSYIRSYIILGVSKLKLAFDKNSLVEAKKITQQGIDASIRFGIPAHIWQFYNLMGIIDTRLKEKTDSVLRVFETVFHLLASQNLLYIGNKDFCFSNLMAISNVGFFFQEINEKSFNSKIEKIIHSGYLHLNDYNYANPKSGYIYSSDSTYLKEQYNRAVNKQLLFIQQPTQYMLRDEETKYFIALS